MNCARNCGNLLNFVKVIPKTLLVPFFSGHGVYVNHLQDAQLEHVLLTITQFLLAIHTFIPQVPLLPSLQASSHFIFICLPVELGRLYEQVFDL